MASKDMYPELISRSARRPAAFVVLALCGTLLAPSWAHAEWSGGIQGGAVIRDGEQSNRIRLSLTNNTRPFSQFIYADWILNSGSDSYEVGYRPRYWFNEKVYALGELTYRTDPVLEIDRETTEAIGVGYQFFQTSEQSAFVEIAAGARQLTFTLPGLEDVSEPFGRARANYSRTLTDIARFRLDLGTIVSERAQESSAEVGVTVKLGTIAVSVGYRVIDQRIEGLPAITDDTTTLSFSYAL